MKKLVSMVLLVLLMTGMWTAIIHAQEGEKGVAEEGVTVIYLEDGRYVTVSEVKGVTKSLSRTASQTVEGYKEVNGYDNDGNVEWTYVLEAAFTYEEGVSSRCTDASYTTNIVNDDWSFSDGVATYSGNVATGAGKFVRKVLFITTDSYIIDIHITCDEYGNLS